MKLAVASASVLAAALLTTLPLSSAWADRPVTLANDEWPPFIVAEGAGGTASRLVCEALSRTGHPCILNVEPWETVIAQARSGEIDGIAAAWKDSEREVFLLFSEPYLTNRIIPVIRSNSGLFIETMDGLAGLRIALVSHYAYGEEIDGARLGFETVMAANSGEALEHVRQGHADAALIDELEARDRLGSMQATDLAALDTVLAWRSLHFAMSRAHPDAAEILADFQLAYQAMLLDGTVNEILDVDWLATDFANSGTINVVMRNGVSLDSLSNPNREGATYALEQSGSPLTRNSDLGASRIRYQVKGESYSSLQSALNTVFGKETVCQHKEYTSTFDCSDLLKDH